MGSQCNALDRLAPDERLSSRFLRKKTWLWPKSLSCSPYTNFPDQCSLQSYKEARLREGTIGQPVLFLGHGGQNRCHIGKARNTLCKLTKSTPKMKKKTRNQMALVQGDCQWLIFTGRNYKGMSQKLSLMEPIKLGRVRSVKLLCPKLGTGTQFALAGSSGFSLLTGFLLTILAGCIAFLGIVWRRGRRRNEDCQGREEEEEEQLHRCDLKKEEREPGCED